MSSKSKKRSAPKSGAASVSVPYQKAAPKAPPVVKPVRGGWLTAAIVIMAIHAVFTTVSLIVLRKAEYANIPPWLYGAAILVGLATLTSAIGLWFWKKWALVLYVVATFASLALGLIVYPSMIAAFYNIIPLGILGAILQSQGKMKYLK
jgi:hypothetical protein